MEEVLRFYRFFGMKLDAGTHDLPDHVTIELEFMKVLTFIEGLASTRGGDTLPVFRAERDFLQRHPARWWPMLEPQARRARGAAVLRQPGGHRRRRARGRPRVREGCDRERAARCVTRDHRGYAAGSFGGRIDTGTLRNA